MSRIRVLFLAQLLTWDMVCVCFAVLPPVSGGCQKLMLFCKGHSQCCLLRGERWGWA